MGSKRMPRLTTAFSLPPMWHLSLYSRIVSSGQSGGNKTMTRVYLLNYEHEKIKLFRNTSSWLVKGQCISYNSIKRINYFYSIKGAFKSRGVPTSKFEDDEPRRHLPVAPWRFVSLFSHLQEQPKRTWYGERRLSPVPTVSVFYVTWRYVTMATGDATPVS